MVTLFCVHTAACLPQISWIPVCNAVSRFATVPTKQLQIRSWPMTFTFFKHVLSMLILGLLGRVPQVLDIVE